MLDALILNPPRPTKTSAAEELRMDQAPQVVFVRENKAASGTRRFVRLEFSTFDASLSEPRSSAKNSSPPVRAASAPNAVTVEPLWQEEARRVLETASESVQRQANRVLRSAAWRAAVMRIDAPHIGLTEDGALKFEWVRADRSLSVFFEEKETDSGWAFASTPSAGGHAEWGTADGLVPNLLFSKLTR